MSDVMRKRVHNVAAAAETKLARIYSEDQPNPVIQERLFVSTFLMMFAIGGSAMNNDAWQGISGTLTNPVDVMRGDEYLFTVPPLMLSPQTRITKRRNVYPQEAMNMRTTETGALLGATERGNSTLLAVDQMSKTVFVDESHKQEYLLRWVEIFKRYNIDYKEIRRQYAHDQENEKRRRKGLDPLPELGAAPPVIVDYSGIYSSVEEDTGISFNGSSHTTPY